ncbi:MAG TPA: hypothetical protein VLL54_12910 [Pyrinomonadaceae bacterium]|nr:hypothetical protein [Pyrinomonadaceae bacterium]
MREARFRHDFLGDSEFRGYTRNEDYNGFACPYFIYEQAMLILTAWLEHGLAASYDENKDEFVFEVSECESGNEFQRFGAIYSNGMKLYPIGVFEWNWEEAENSELQSQTEMAKVARLFQTPAEELVKIEPAEWQATFSDIHGEDLRLLSNSLINLSVLAARMSGYIDARGGEGGKDRGHVEAVSEQNQRAERVRAVLGFQDPKADIDIGLS